MKAMRIKLAIAALCSCLATFLMLDTVNLLADSNQSPLDIVKERNKTVEKFGKHMPAEINKRKALSVGQLAVRWGLGVARVRKLVESGQLTGAFKIPSAGKFGETIRIPLPVIERAEEKWAIGSIGPRIPQRKRSLQRGSFKPVLKHFPELPANCAGDAESHGASPIADFARGPWSRAWCSPGLLRSPG